MPKEVLNVGLLGCGAIGQIAHIPAALRAQQVRLAALSDNDELLLRNVAQRAGVECRYSDYADMLADNALQAVILAVPDPLHVRLATQALEAGKHVLVEKPLGATSAECRDLIRQVDATGLKLQVGCMKRHDPGVRFAHQHIREKIGRILSFSATYRDSLFRPAMQETCLDPILSGNRPTGTGDDWKADRRRYNLITQGAHLFDMIHHLAGPITAVHVRETEYDGNYSWHGLLERADGSVGHFELTCKACGDWQERYNVCGESGSVDLDVGLWFFHRPAQVRAFDGQTQQWSQPLGGHSNAFANQLDSFAEAIFHDRPTCPGVRDGLAVVELLEAVEESLKTGRRIETCRTDEG